MSKPTAGAVRAARRPTFTSGELHHSTTNAAPVPEALPNFDQLFDSGHVRLPVVCALLACSPATVWRRVKSGHIPAPKKLGPNVTAWNVGELRQALAALNAAE